MASRYDKSARRIVELWRPHDVHVLTCEEISVAGWRHYLSDAKMSTGVINGKKINVEQIDGVLTRLPYVTEAELPNIVLHDRSYVAAEMMAFLVSWLSCLKCPVLNRPTPLCLLGPNWSQEQWIYAAANIGIPVRSICTSSQSNMVHYSANDIQRVTVNVIGDHCYGAVDDEMAEESICLTRASGVDMLSIHFIECEKHFLFIGASLWLQVDCGNISNAILNYFIEKHNKTTI